MKVIIKSSSFALYTKLTRKVQCQEKSSEPSLLYPFSYCTCSCKRYFSSHNFDFNLESRLVLIIRHTSLNSSWTQRLVWHENLLKREVFSKENLSIRYTANYFMVVHVLPHLWYLKIKILMKSYLLSILRIPNNSWTFLIGTTLLLIVIYKKFCCFILDLI